MRASIATVAALCVAGVGIGAPVYAAGGGAVPSWVRGVAGLWADGEISKAEFLGAIKYLIGEGANVVPGNSDSRTYMTKEHKFSVWQPENWERQMMDPGLGLWRIRLWSTEPLPAACRPRSRLG